MYNKAIADYTCFAYYFKIVSLNNTILLFEVMVVDVFTIKLRFTLLFIN